MAEDLDDFAPDTIELTTTLALTTSRTIAQLFSWNDETTFRAIDAYSLALVLNDSDDSIYGPGIFLDDAASILGIPSYEPDVILPTDDWYIQSRTLEPRFHKRFGIVYTQPTQFQPDTDYRISWTTPPGDADTDNANIETELDTKLTAFCPYRICVRPSIRCFANAEEWSIDPIPGSHIFTKPLHRCFDYNFFRWFLPLLRQ